VKNALFVASITFAAIVAAPVAAQEDRGRMNEMGSAAMSAAASMFTET